MEDKELQIKFSKMHGAGNDYIYVNCFEQELTNPEEFAIKYSERNFGIGSDGLVMIMPSTVADCRMRMFNADGSEGKMCGNAIRCIGKYVYDKGLAKKENITVETLSGIKKLKMTIENGVATAATVDMGEPILESEKIPVRTKEKIFINEEIIVNGKKYLGTCVSMGNPHCVVFTHDIDNIKLSEIGPLFETYELFPDRINTEFVEVVDNKTLRMRVWERGSGETLACGTGACAVAAAAVLHNITKKNEDITVKLKGGELIIRWADDGRVYMTGTATHVFDGVVNI